MDILIRKIKEDDKKDYLEMAKDFYNSPATLHQINDINFEITFNELINNNIYIDGYIVEYFNQIAGYVLLSKTFSQEIGSKVLLIEEIYLKEEFRSKGIWKEIFKFLEKEYYDFKRFRLELTSNNEIAAKAYKKCGFKNLDYIQMILDKD